MSEKVAHTLGQATARNVRFWRGQRGLDQQGLADRLEALGWGTDRTTVTRIEKGSRKITVDDLGLLAVALSVPIPVLLLPLHDDVQVRLTPGGKTDSVNPWRAWRWFLGLDPLPGENLSTGEWRSGVMPLWLYDAVDRAQQSAQKAHLEDNELAYRRALQALVDAIASMESSGLPAKSLLADDFATAIRELGISESSRQSPRTDRP